MHQWAVDALTVVLAQFSALCREEAVHRRYHANMIALLQYAVDSSSMLGDIGTSWHDVAAMVVSGMKYELIHYHAWPYY